LRHIKVSEAHRRDALQAEQLGGLDPTMARDDLAILSDQHRIGKTKPSDTLCDLPDLLPGMGPGIVGVRSRARHSR
jgi:hypothetical protein